jgi:hypothetical protein
MDMSAAARRLTPSQQLPPSQSEFSSWHEPSKMNPAGTLDSCVHHNPEAPEILLRGSITRPESTACGVPIVQLISCAAVRACVIPLAESIVGCAVPGYTATPYFDTAHRPARKTASISAGAALAIYRRERNKAEKSTYLRPVGQPVARAVKFVR